MPGQPADKTPVRTVFTFVPQNNDGMLPLCACAENTPEAIRFLILARMPLLSRRQGREGGMGQCLIPVRNAGYVILTLKQPGWSAADLLKCDPKVFFKENRIRDMPAVESPHRWDIPVESQAVDRIIP